MTTTVSGRGALLNLSFEVEGEVQLNRALGVLMARTNDLSTVWPGVRDVLIEEAAAQFGSEGSHGGTPWPALSPPYAAWKAAHYGQKPILVRTGALKTSLTAAGSGDMLFQPGRTGMSWGTHVSYSVYHQSPAPRRRLPRRPMVMLTETAKREIPRLVQAHLMRENGFLPRAVF